MIGMEPYLNAYVDRRMKYVIEEWDLSTRRDLEDLDARLDALERETSQHKKTGRAFSDKLAELEARAERLKGGV